MTQPLRIKVGAYFLSNSLHSNARKYTSLYKSMRSRERVIPPLTVHYSALKSTSVGGRQRTAVIRCGTFLSKPRSQTVVTSSAVGSIPAKAKLFFSVYGLFKAHFFGDHSCLSFCFDNKIAV